LPPLGAHLSIAGGAWRAVDRAEELGCTALQIFTQPPGRWQGREIPVEEAARFRKRAREARLVGVTFAHAPYLINVASGDRALWRRSVDLLTDQLARARLLGLDGLVLHPGAHLGDGFTVAAGRAVEGIREAMDREPGAPRLLLEVTAGHGTAVGSSFDELASLTERLPEARLGVCWDTAHLWAAGHDVASEAGWSGLWRRYRDSTRRAVPDFVHLNDTPVDLGSRVDRHERIGHGRLGFDAFVRIVGDRRLRKVPMVLETPKGPDEVTWDRQALAQLRAAVGRLDRDV
jgi:deoxyribonuclease-4